MKKPKPTKGKPTQRSGDEEEGYPLYPERDDIYSKSTEDKDVDPDDFSKVKEDEDELGLEAEEDSYLEDDIMGGDLDVPGSELDDDDEDIGNEDEENNYYSIGGDKHNDLDEDNQTYDLEEEDEED